MDERNTYPLHRVFLPKERINTKTWNRGQVEDLWGSFRPTKITTRGQLSLRMDHTKISWLTIKQQKHLEQSLDLLSSHNRFSSTSLRVWPISFSLDVSHTDFVVKFRYCQSGNYFDDLSHIICRLFSPSMYKNVHLGEVNRGKFSVTVDQVSVVMCVCFIVTQKWVTSEKGPFFLKWTTVSDGSLFVHWMSPWSCSGRVSSVVNRPSTIHRVSHKSHLSDSGHKSHLSDSGVLSIRKLCVIVPHVGVFSFVPWILLTVLGYQRFVVKLHSR